MNVNCNDIPARQNSQQHIEQLAAQRRLYSISKRLVLLQTAASLLSPIIWPVVVAIFPSTKIGAAIYGIFYPIFDAALIDYLKNVYRKQAAGIQEMFDCDVLSIPPNPLKVPDEVHAEVIKRRSAEYLNKFTDAGLRDWYPLCAGETALGAGRLICQRTNFIFDIELREKCATALITIPVILGLIAILTGICFGFTLDQWLLGVIVPVQPAVWWAIKEWKQHRDSIGELHRVRKYIEGIWTGARLSKLSDTEILIACRQIQDALYDHRRRCSPVFDLVFDKMRKRLQAETDGVAADWVNEVS